MSEPSARSNDAYAKPPATFTDETPLQLALREIRGLLRSPAFWGGLVAVTLVLAIAAPFRTGEVLNFAQRLAYWGGVCIATYPPATFISVWTGRGLPRLGVPELPAWAAGGLLASVPVVTIIAAINVWAVGFSREGAPPHRVIALQCVVISVAIVALHYLLRDRSEPSAETTALPLIQSKLPLAVLGPVRHLVMQDHDARVTTAKGSDPVLMRMADAVASLDGADGLQVHRSRWVRAMRWLR